MTIEEHVWLTHDNTFELEVNINETPVNLVSTGVTRMVITTDTGLEIDSDVEGEGAGNAFDWATSGATGIVIFTFGGLTIDAGRYLCRLTIFDPTNTNGQVWDTEFYMIVHDAIVT